MIVEEMENDIEKYLNNKENLCTNQEMLRMREVFRGVMFKKWVIMPNEIIDYLKHNKLLIEKGVRLYSEFWNKRCVVLHNPDAQKQFLIKDVKSIKIETRSGAIENYNNYADTHSMNEEIDTIKSMVRWFKSARFFRKNTRKSRQQDIRHFLFMS